MEHSSNDYHISFFKPTTPQATRNRNLVVWLVSIWFVAIFGFHILLRVIEKPTPEPAYIAFEEAWSGVSQGDASEIQLQKLGQSALSVLGKIDIQPDAKAAMQDALAYSVANLTVDSMQSTLVAEVEKLEVIRNQITDISDPAYLDAKKKISAKLSPVLGLDKLDVKTKILPLEIVSVDMANLDEKSIASIPTTMEKYLIHNQSFLTDTKFLGFPFHYFYSAVFLLILFVALCWIYCVRIDKMNAKLGIEE